MGLLDFLCVGRQAPAKSRARCVRTTRRPCVEPLEERMLLSVASGFENLNTAPAGTGSFPAAFVADEPAGSAVNTIQSAGAEVPAQEDTGGQATSAIEAQAWLRESVRVSVWTPELIADLPSWVHSRDWPEWMTDVWVEGQPMEEMGTIQVDELIHMPLWSDPRGGYRTILRIDGGFRGVTVDEMLGDLEQLDFVDHVRLESESVVQYGPNAQKAIDKTTMDAGPGEASLFGIDPAPESALPLRMRVTFWTQENVPDVDAFVTAHDWPQGLGAVTAENVGQLATIPIRSEARGGYFTIVTIDVSGDITRFDEVDFVEHARLESESVVRFDSRVQALLNATRMDAGEGEAQLLLAESRDLTNVDSFRDNEDFLGIDGSGLAVAILDTGIDSGHAFFQDRVVYEYDFYGNNDEDADDKRGHGTHVASIAAGYDENPGDGDYSGVAPGADIVNLKVFPDYTGGAPWTDIEEALQWVVDHANTHNIASVNMSLGDGNYQTAQSLHGLGDQIADLAAMGVIVVSASGNSFYGYGSAEGVAYPSADPNSLAVGAIYDADLGREPDAGTYADGSYATTTDPDRIAPFSQRDDELTTIMAPGAVITAAAMGGGVTDMSGTSMAAPHIAGMAVLAQQLALQELGQRLTQEQFVALLQSTADTVNDGDDEDDNVTNTGLDFPRVDMLALGDAIMALHWQIDANNDPAPGDQKDDGNPDTFEVNRVGGTIQVKINGSVVDAKSLSDVVRITITGSTDTDTFDVNSLGADFTGNLVINATVGGQDVAFLDDSPGVDTFKAWPTVGTFQMQDAYKITANNIRSLYGSALNGGDDVAHLYGEDGADDRFTSNKTPDIATLVSANHYTRATSFRYVHGDANAGDADDAVLYGRDGEVDTFESNKTPGKATLISTNEYARANGFHNVVANGNANDVDVAKMYGENGAVDTFKSNQTPDKATLQSANYFARANSFAQVHGNANATDADQAYLWGEAGAVDTLESNKTPDKVTLISTNEYARANSFRYVYGYGNAGDADEAKLYGEDGDNDTFKSNETPDKATLVSTNEYTRATSFRNVYADANANDADVAKLWGEAGAVDTFKSNATPDAATLTSANEFARANSFSNVYAYANAGDADVAKLYGEAGAADTFKSNATPDAATLTSTNEYARANSFRYVYAYANVGDADVAKLYDSSEEDTFTAYPEDAWLYSNSYSNRAYSFRYVHAYAEFGSEGTDTAYLYDSTGDDELMARDADPTAEDWARLRDAADAIYALWAYGFDSVSADSGTGDNDTTDIGPNLDFALNLTGSWEN